MGEREGSAASAVPHTRPTRSVGHRARPTPTLTLAAVAPTIEQQSWSDLHHTARRILTAMALVSEAPTQRLHATPIHSARPGAQPPRGGRALAGVHSRRITEASRARDRPRLEAAILEAVADLEDHKRRPDHPEGDSDRTGLERDDYILTRYTGWTADRAARVETARTGFVISAAAIRKVRGRNGLNRETGHQLPPRDQQLADVLALHYEGRSVREIGVALGLAKSTVHDWTRDHQQGQAA